MIPVNQKTITRITVIPYCSSHDVSVAAGGDATSRRSGLGMVTYYRDANELMCGKPLDCYGIMTVNITLKLKAIMQKQKRGA